MRVMFLVHDYPPAGGGGVQRPLHFVRALHRAGHAVHVMSADRDPGPLRDDTLLLRHPPEVPITRYRVPSLEPVQGIFRRNGMSRVPGLFLPADIYPESALFQRWTALQVIGVGKSFRPDVVVASAPPFGLLDAGRRAAVALKARLVLDMRDPWAEPSLGAMPAPWIQWWARRQQRRSFAAADLVVVTAPTLEKHYAQLERGRPRKTVTITNGFDDLASADRAAHDEAADLVRAEGVRTVVFAGRLFSAGMPSEPGLKRAVFNWVFGRLERGGRVLRAAEYHLGPWYAAQEHLATSRPDLSGRLRTVLLGDVPRVQLPPALQAAFPVEFAGYRRLAVATEALRQADALLFLNISTVDDSPSCIIPGKLFEYLAAGRPILATCGPGDAVDILRDAGVGTWVHDHQPAQLGNALAVWLDGAPLTFSPQAAVVAGYSRTELGKRFVAALESVVAAPEAPAP